jgi:hypothetical protein
MTHTDPPVTAASIAAAKQAALHELRDVALVGASVNGHVLGMWHELDDATEVAYCRGCWRAAVVDVLRDPHFAGPALSERCTADLSPADRMQQHLREFGR